MWGDRDFDSIYYACVCAWRAINDRIACMGPWKYSSGGNKVFQFCRLTLPSFKCNGELVKLAEYSMDILRPSSLEQIADQYKPAPGSPYRPVLSPPEQIYRLQPGWLECVITHAFAGIDPPRSLTPAAALVPNPTPTSPQSHTTETSSASSLKSVSKAAKAGVTGAPIKLPPAPAHKVQTAGPRSTLSPPSPFPNNDPREPESSLDPRSTHAAKTLSQLNGWQAQISSDEASKFQASFKKARDSTVQDPAKDTSFVSFTTAENSEKASDISHSSRLASDQRPNMKSALSSNAGISDWLRTHGEEYEDGVSSPVAAITPTPSSNDGRGQDPFWSAQETLPRHENLPHESKPLQGTANAEPGSPRLGNHMSNDISTQNLDPPNQTIGNIDSPSTRVIGDPLVDPILETNTARNPDVGSSTRATLQNLPDPPLLDEQGKQQAQISSAGSNVDEALKSAALVVSKSFPEAGGVPLISTTLMESTLIPEARSDPLASTTSIASTAISELKPDTLIDSPASTDTNPTSLISGSNTYEASAPTKMIVSKGSPDMTPHSLRPHSVPSSDIPPVLADANTLSDPQSKSSNSIKAVLGNQTTPALKPNGTLTAGTQARASSLSKNVVGSTTVLPFKNGVEKGTGFCLISSFVCLASFHVLLRV